MLRLDRPVPSRRRRDVDEAGHRARPGLQPTDALRSADGTVADFLDGLIARRRPIQVKPVTRTLELLPVVRGEDHATDAAVSLSATCINGSS